MTPFKFAGYQRELGKPKNWDDTYECVSLPVCDGDKTIISHWKPSFSERLKILFGAGVWLFVSSTSKTQPPVALQAGFTKRAS